MTQPSWVWRLCFALFAVAGLAVVVTALIASGGDLTAGISVRGSGDGTIPAPVVLAVGTVVAAGGVVGFVCSRD